MLNSPSLQVVCAWSSARSGAWVRAITHMFGSGTRCPCLKVVAIGQRSGEAARLLLVAFDDLVRPGGSRVGVLPRVAASAALAQQIPALVEREPDLLEAAAIVVRRSAVRLAAPELVLLGDEVLDGSVDLGIVHQSVSPSR